MTKTPSVEQSMGVMVDTVHGIAESKRPQQAQIGIILAPPPEIQVALNDIILTKDDVYISEYLLVGYERTAKGHIVSGTQTACSHCSHAHVIDNDYTDNIIYTDTLKVGDRVSVIPLAGDQLYFIEDKVVKL